jgi:NAD(P)-dependent dehydrogenase (short-subunit alcohol dehydrogenase family)
MALAKDNILVNSLNMGWIDTGQWDRHYREMSPTISRQEFLTMATKVVPLGRFGKPEDVVGMVLFLCSEFAGFITAASIDISGGLQGQIAYYPTLKRELMELGIAREKAAEENSGR